MVVIKVNVSMDCPLGQKRVTIIVLRVVPIVEWWLLVNVPLYVLLLHGIQALVEL